MHNAAYLLLLGLIWPLMSSELAVVLPADIAACPAIFAQIARHGMRACGYK